MIKKETMKSFKFSLAISAFVLLTGGGGLWADETPFAYEDVCVGKWDFNSVANPLVACGYGNTLAVVDKTGAVQTGLGNCSILAPNAVPANTLDQSLGNVLSIPVGQGLDIRPYFPTDCKAWTIRMRVYFPGSDWKCFFFKPGVSDGALFIKANESIIGASQYTTVAGIRNAWHELLLVYDNGSLTVVVDGCDPIINVANRISSGSDLAFVDNNGEDGLVYLASYEIFTTTDYTRLPAYFAAGNFFDGTLEAMPKGEESGQSFTFCIENFMGGESASAVLEISRTDDFSQIVSSSAIDSVELQAEQTITVKNLSGGKYFARLRLTNNLGDEVVSPYVSFTVAGAIFYRPGLMQYRYRCESSKTADFNYDLAQVLVDNIDRTYGCIMGNKSFGNGGSSVKSTVEESATGTQWWWDNNTSYAYTGQIWLEAGTTLTVWGNFDDGSAFFIDDTAIFNQGTGSGYNGKAAVGLFTADETRWYDIRGYVWDWSGGKNICQGALAALQWNTANYTKQDNNEKWAKFVCNNDFSFLRTPADGSALSLDGVVKVGNGYLATVSIGTVSGEAQIYVLLGDDPAAGDSNSMWREKVELGTVTAGDTKQYQLETNFAYAKFVVVGNDEIGPFEHYLDAVRLADAPTMATSFVPTFDITAHYTDIDVVCGVLDDRTIPASGITVTAVLSENENLSAPIYSGVIGTLTRDSVTFTKTIEGIEASSTYYIQLVFSDGQNEASAFTSFTTATPMNPEIGVWYNEDEQTATTLVMSGFAKIGTSSAVVYADFAASKEALLSGVYDEFVISGENPLVSDWDFNSLSIMIPQGNSAFAFRLRIVNDFNVVATTEPFTFGQGPKVVIKEDTTFLSPSAAVEFVESGLGGSFVNTVTFRLWTTDDRSGEPLQQKTFEVDVTTFPFTLPAFYFTERIGLPANAIYYMDVVVGNNGGFTTVSDLLKVKIPNGGDNVWANTGTDVTVTSSYIYDWLPESANKLYFSMPAGEGTSPVIDTDLEMPSLYFSLNGGNANDEVFDGFHSDGYVISGSGKITLKNEMAIRQNTLGTNVIENTLRFERSNGAKAKVSVSKGDLFLDGTLEKSENNFTLRFEVAANAGIHLRGDSSNYKGEVFISTPDASTISLENTNALTGVKRFVFCGNSGKSGNKNFANNSGAPMVFAATNIQFGVEGWGSQCDRFNGFPFIFPAAQFNYCEREGNGTIIDADVTVKDIYHSSGMQFMKSGHGIFTVLGKHISSSDTTRDRTEVMKGCFYPKTTDGWDAAGCIYLRGSEGGTIGLDANFYPNLDGSNPRRPLSLNHNDIWGYTAITGNVEVCYYDGTEVCYVKNKDTTGSKFYYTDTETSVLVSGKHLSDYCAWPRFFHFGNRSQNATGTILFKNPMLQDQNFEETTYCESSGHIVAARLQGAIACGHQDRTWSFDGRSVGGTIALEADNSEFVGRLKALNKAHLLVNGPINARSATVEKNSVLGGMNTLSTAEGLTVETDGALCGGEWGKGGMFKVKGSVNFKSGSEIRVEIPASGEAGFVCLANDDAAKTLSISTVKVRIDLEDLTSRGRVKVLDWTDAVYKNGILPTLDNFEVVFDEAVTDAAPRLSIENNALYVKYRGVNAPKGFILIVR